MPLFHHRLETIKKNFVSFRAIDKDMLAFIIMNTDDTLSLGLIYNSFPNVLLCPGPVKIISKRPKCFDAKILERDLTGKKTTYNFRWPSVWHQSLTFIEFLDDDLPPAKSLTMT